MAKRFGRNQRRRMREQIAELTSAGEGLKQAARSESDARQQLGDRIQYWASNMRRVLGPGHALNEKIEMQVLRDRIGDRHRYALRPPLPRISFDQQAITDAMSVIDMIVHHVQVARPTSADVSYGPRALVQLQAGDGASVHYAIDEATLFEARQDTRFVEWLAAEIQRQLVEAYSPQRRAA